MAHSSLPCLVSFLHLRASLAVIIARHVDLLVEGSDMFLKELLHVCVARMETGLGRTIRVAEVK